MERWARVGGLQRISGSVTKWFRSGGVQVQGTKSEGKVRSTSSVSS